MITVLLVKANTTLVEKRLKSFDEELLYKACNYKTSDGFERLHCYRVNDDEFIIYGKKDGKANHENKYDLPPPIDSALYFGTLCIFKKYENQVVSISQKEWESAYEKLFGGFEDIDSKDEERSEDSEVYSDEDYTNEGYVKDGFVVGDDELEEEEYV